MERAQTDKTRLIILRKPNERAKGLSLNIKITSAEAKRHSEEVALVLTRALAVEKKLRTDGA